MLTEEFIPAVKSIWNNSRYLWIFLDSLRSYDLILGTWIIVKKLVSMVIFDLHSVFHGGDFVSKQSLVNICSNIGFIYERC